MEIVLKLNKDSNGEIKSNFQFYTYTWLKNFLPSWFDEKHNSFPCAFQGNGTNQ